MTEVDHGSPATSKKGKGKKKGKKKATIDYDDDEIDKIEEENEKLIQQLGEFVKEMEIRMDYLTKKEPEKKKTKETDDVIKKVRKLDTAGKKIKYLKSEI